MRSSSLIEFLRAHVLGAIAGSAILTAACTAFFSDYVNFRNTTRTLIQAEYDKSRGIQVDVDNALQKFADRANGTGTTSDADLDNLRKAIKSSFATAEQVAIRVPSVRSSFDGLAEQLIQLQRTAEHLRGPAEGGKDFVTAVANYSYALDAFDNAVVKSQDRWLALK